MLRKRFPPTPICTVQMIFLVPIETVMPLGPAVSCKICTLLLLFQDKLASTNLPWHMGRQPQKRKKKISRRLFLLVALVTYTEGMPDFFRTSGYTLYTSKRHHTNNIRNTKQIRKTNIARPSEEALNVQENRKILNSINLKPQIRQCFKAIVIPIRLQT